MPTNTHSRIDQVAAGEPPVVPWALLGEREQPLGVDDLPTELFDELLAGVRTQEDLLGSEGLVKQLTRRLVERALEVELSDHLGYAWPGAAGRGGQ